MRAIDRPADRGTELMDGLMAGSIDMHVHFNPDSNLVRRLDALQTAEYARDLGMRALVLKSRDYNTVPVAQLVSKLVPEVAVYGGVTLNPEVGGLNVAAAVAAAKMGAKVIWMATTGAANSKAKTERTRGLDLAGYGAGVCVLDSSGKLLPEAKEIIRIAREYDIVLGTGHLSVAEDFALAEEATAVGFAKLVITHALQGERSGMDSFLTAEQITQLARGGAFIEHCFWGWMPTVSTDDPMQLVESMKSTGPERCIMSTDFGQIYHPPAPEGFRLFIATRIRVGVSE
ncbi:MAG: hypothetical protein HYY32_04690 [Chloroflexi bacterium]|nr:hypothetical protein [Chloroflexota bacterium]